MHNYDVHRMDKMKTVFLWLGLPFWLNQSTDQHTQASFCLYEGSVLQEKDKNSSGFTVGEAGVRIMVPPLKSIPMGKCLTSPGLSFHIRGLLYFKKTAQCLAELSTQTY